MRSWRLLLAALSLLLGSHGALASGPPDWMLAQVAMPLPEHEVGAEAIVLYAEDVVSVLPDGKVRHLQRTVTRILRPEGAKFEATAVQLNDQTRLLGMRGWCIPPTGKPYSVTDHDAVEAGLLGQVTDFSRKLLRVPGATTGSVVAFEIDVETARPERLVDQWLFQGSVPVHETHYELHLPPGWRYQASWINRPEEAPSVRGAGDFLWVLRDVTSIETEPHMPPLHAIAGRMMVAMIPPTGQQHNLQSWQDLGQWWLDLMHGRQDPSPALLQKVAEVTAGASTPSAKVRALARWVQEQVRYMAIELGIGGLQPHPAAAVLAGLYGDCKDKVTLLGAMLEQIGVHSYYVIVNTERGAIGASTPANLSFNHAIIAIEAPADLPDSEMPALVSVPGIGKLLIFDPTDTFTPFGKLRGPLQGAYGLLLAPEHSGLIELPRLPPSANSLERTARLSLDEMGTLSGDVQETWIGDRASAQRSTFDSSKEETSRIKPVERVVAQSIADFSIPTASIINPHVTDSPLIWKYTLEAAHYAKTSGDLLIVRPRVIGSKVASYLEEHKERHYPIEFESTLHDTDQFDIALPPGYAVDDLPNPVSVDLGYASYRSKCETVGHSLRYTRTFEIKELSVPAEHAEELRQFFRTIEGDEHSAVILKRSASS